MAGTARFSLNYEKNRQESPFADEMGNALILHNHGAADSISAVGGSFSENEYFFNLSSPDNREGFYYCRRALYGERRENDYAE